MALDVPVLDDIQVLSAYEQLLTWTNGGDYQYVEVWQNISGGGYGATPLATLMGHKESYEATGLTENLEHCYKIIGGIWEPPEESAASNEKCAFTHDLLEAPTELVATAYGNGGIELIWLDNSVNEDGFKIERKTLAGGFAQIDTVAKNVDFYRDTGLVKGQEYTYRVRAYQGVSDSGYSNENSATVIAVPDAPADLAISELTNKTLRLTFTGVANETGYKIEKSADGNFIGEEEEIAVIGEDITEYLVTGLDPSTQYWFRVRAYNAAGNSGYSGTVNDTTDASYSLTTFEKFIRSPVLKPIYLIEINPKKTLTGWVLTDGKTYTYEITLPAEDRGIDIEMVSEDGADYSEQGSIEDVESHGYSFYFDYYARKVYIHTSGINPASALIEGRFWLYFTNNQTGDITFNDHNYLEFFSEEDIPDMTREIKSYFEGMFGISTGTIGFKNRMLGGANFFDKKYTTYTWEDAKMIIKLGGEDFSYTDFVDIFTGYVHKKSGVDSKFTLQLKDLRQFSERKLILDTYAINDFPNISEDFLDEPIPKCWGIEYNAMAACVDVNRGKYKFHDGRIKSVENVVLKHPDDEGEFVSETLEQGVDYYVDYQRGMITIDSSIALDEEDLVEIVFIGTVDSADNPIQNGAEIFKDIMNNHYGLINVELDHDSIYQAKYADEAPLTVYLYRDESYATIIRNIEHSIKAYTFTEGSGKLGLNPLSTVVQHDVKYTRSFQVFDYGQETDPDALYWKVNVYYRENPLTQEWDVKSAWDSDIQVKYGTENELDIYTYLFSPTSAQALADSIKGLFNHEFIYFSISMLLFDQLPGKLIKFSRDRAYTAAGTADNLTVRLLKVQQSPANKQTIIRGELVS